MQLVLDNWHGKVQKMPGTTDSDICVYTSCLGFCGQVQGRSAYVDAVTDSN